MIKIVFPLLGSHPRMMLHPVIHDAASAANDGDGILRVRFY
jgi:hypothetical protein